MNKQIYCLFCNEKLNINAKFCTKCGNKVSNEFVEQNRGWYTKKRNIIALILVVLVGIGLFVKNNYQKGYDNVMFVSDVTNGIRNTDGYMGLSGAECVEIVHNMQDYSDNDMQFDMDDLKLIMRVFKEEGGNDNIKNAHQYNKVIMQVFQRVNNLSTFFKSDDYAYLTTELMSFHKYGFTLKSSEKKVIETHLAAQAIGKSYSEVKTIINSAIDLNKDIVIDPRMVVEKALNSVYDYKELSNSY